MPWKECDAMSLRYEFVQLVQAEKANIRLLCRRFGISPKTGYKWLHRYCREGIAGLADQSRRPYGCPHQTRQAMVEAVLGVRRDHPAWGGRKIRRWLQDRGKKDVPSASTITHILGQAELIAVAESESRRKIQRFERTAPNDLWQLDFKGEFRLTTEQYCYPLTSLDDHSRYNLILRGGGVQKRSRVQKSLREAFARYGLPKALLCDHGPPWCSRHGGLTRLTLWLLRLGIEVLHGRVRHPQTQGKLERFHRTLATEVLNGRMFRDWEHVQAELDAWRVVYNHERPHEALDLQTPCQRYHPSERSFPSVLPAVEYEPSATVRKVNGGVVRYRTRMIWVGKTLDGESVALRPNQGSQMRICYGGFEIGRVDLDEIAAGSYGRAKLFASLRSANSLAEPGSSC